MDIVDIKLCVLFHTIYFGLEVYEFSLAIFAGELLCTLPALVYFLPGWLRVRILKRIIYTYLILTNLCRKNIKEHERREDVWSLPVYAVATPHTSCVVTWLHSFVRIQEDIMQKIIIKSYKYIDLTTQSQIDYTILNSWHRHWVYGCLAVKNQTKFSGNLVSVLA